MEKTVSDLREIHQEEKEETCGQRKEKKPIVKTPSIPTFGGFPIQAWTYLLYLVVSRCESSITFACIKETY